MGTHYQQLTIEERCEISRLHAAGRSIRQVASSLDRSPSTIARELNRNAAKSQGYQPSYAQQQARARRWRGSRLQRNPELRGQVLAGLKAGWSPEQVAGRLALEAGRRVRDHLPLHLRATGSQEGLRLASLPPPGQVQTRLARAQGRQFRRLYPTAPALGPSDADHRRAPGHWEADLMLFGNRGPTVLALHERHSRLLIALRRQGRRTHRGPGQDPARLPATVAPVRLSTTAPSSPVITGSTAWAWLPSSAIPAPPGRRAAWKTPSDDCGASCPARPTWPRCRQDALLGWCRPTTTPHANAWATGRLRKFWHVKCCT